MRINIVLTHEQITPQVIKDKICVVIDTLRATSTIITALNGGCTEVIPVPSSAAAFALRSNPVYRDYILGGEIEGQYIENFHKANSPLEYSNGWTKGRGLILTTINGTRTLTKVKAGSLVLVCALLNAKVVGHYLTGREQDLLICCAGRRGNFSLEDFLTAGRLIGDLEKQNRDFEPTDLAYAASCFYRYIRKRNPGENGLAELLKNTANGRRLAKAGLEADVIYCAQEDMVPVVPVYKDGAIKLAENEYN
jgi:2-phosphosulfolactate phosphatase